MQPAIRHRSNSTFDIEHEIIRAERMRRDTPIDIMRNARPTMLMIAACGALLLAVVVFGRHDSGPRQLMQVSSAAHIAKMP